ncbi:MAG TPA: beta-propeller fold lactonase family protein, partial [Methanosarcina sp.]|nr:beta-propeller fold lactonase family protein [Methanosarcina sp.]
MKEIKCDKTFKRQTFNKALWMIGLAFLMLVSIAGASPFAYITNSEGNSVSVIDATTNKVTTTIPVGSNPIGVAINPNGTKVYVVNARSSDVSVIDTATNSVVATVRAGNFPQGIVVSPNGKKVYVTHRYSNNVSVIDTGENTAVSTLNTG